MHPTEAHGGHALAAHPAVPVVMECHMQLAEIGDVVVAAADEVNVLVPIADAVVELVPRRGHEIAFAGHIQGAVRAIHKRAMVHPDMMSAILDSDAIAFAPGVRILENEI